MELSVDRRSPARDDFLAPVMIDELNDALGPTPNEHGQRASDKGFLNMSLQAYIELLDWTARQIVPGKRGSTPAEAPAILERLQLDVQTWCQLATNFGNLFSLVAGRPDAIDAARTRGRQSRYRAPRGLRELMAS